MTDSFRRSTGRSHRLLSLAGTVALLLAVAGWAAYLRPQALGGPATFVAVVGESMRPMLEAGDLVVAREQDTYHRGDVVAFRIPEDQPGAGATVIHRIVGGGAVTGYRMRGDNKPLPDLWRPRDEDVLGRSWLRVPHGGTVLRVLGSPLGAGLSAGLLVFCYVLSGGRHRPAAPQVVAGPG